jgi:hypothetical protein
VDHGGKWGAEKLFPVLSPFSTSFPQTLWTGKASIDKQFRLFCTNSQALLLLLDLYKKIS